MECGACGAWQDEWSTWHGSALDGLKEANDVAMTLNAQLVFELTAAKKQLAELDCALSTRELELKEMYQNYDALRVALVKISNMDNLRVDYWNNEDLIDAVSVASEALLKHGR